MASLSRIEASFTSCMNPGPPLPVTSPLVHAQYLDLHCVYMTQVPAAGGTELLVLLSQGPQMCREGHASYIYTRVAKAQPVTLSKHLKDTKATLLPLTNEIVIENDGIVWRSGEAFICRQKYNSPLKTRRSVAFIATFYIFYRYFHANSSTLHPHFFFLLLLSVSTIFSWWLLPFLSPPVYCFYCCLIVTSVLTADPPLKVHLTVPSIAILYLFTVTFMLTAPPLLGVRCLFPCCYC